MSNSNQKVEVTDPIRIDEKEIIQAKDFSKVISRFDEARKPLTKRRLFEYRQRWFFITIVIIVLIILIILGLI
ncbi:MAG: hypothetical protein KDC13_06635 [Bacteroidetes bacterium]|nr:hypothetical protein [Bacteroidota bacterium]